MSTNRDSIRCYRYREYDHFAIETIYHRDNSRERFERSRDRNREHDQEQECFWMIEWIGQDQNLDLDPI